MRGQNWRTPPQHTPASTSRLYLHAPRAHYFILRSLIGERGVHAKSALTRLNQHDKKQKECHSLHFIPAEPNLLMQENSYPIFMCTRAYMCVLAAAGSVAHFVFIHHDVYYTWVTFAKGLRWVLPLSPLGAASAAGPLAFGDAATLAKTYSALENGENVLLFLFWRGMSTRKSGQAATAFGLK